MSETQELKEMIGLLFLKIQELEDKIDAKEVNIKWDPPLPDIPQVPNYPQYPNPAGPFWEWKDNLL